MFGVGFRTPAKGPATTESPTSIEDSLTTPERRSPAPAVVPKAPPKSKPKALSQDSTRSVRKMSTESKESPPKAPRYATRTAEAKACLVKAKLHLGNSRNLKTDIKAEVTQVIERLYTLVKEAEAQVEPKEGSGQSPANFLPRKKVLKDGEVEGLQVELGEAISVKLMKKIEKHERLLKESNEAIERLKNALENKTIEGEKSTYAAVTAGGAPRGSPIQTTLHSIVVTSKDEEETGEEVLKQIRETVNAKDGWVKVERVRKIKNRRVIVGCATEEERRKVKERLEQASDRLSVEDIRNKNPLVMLRDVLSYNTDEDILKALKNQNRAIFDDPVVEGDKMEVCFRRKTRNPHACHMVMRVPPKVWRRMTEAGAVHIDLQKVRVVDHSPLVQCSLCLGYGHSKRLCKETVAKCSHCGGPHLRAECTDWIANVPPTCCNCTRAGLGGSAEHNAFSQECSVRRKWDALARSSIAYC